MTVQGQFGTVPTSHLPASSPWVLKGLIQPKHAEGNICMVPAGVEHLSTPYDSLQLAQHLRSTSAVFSHTVVSKSHRSRAPAIHLWFWAFWSGSWTQNPYSTPAAQDLVATCIVRIWCQSVILSQDTVLCETVAQARAPGSASLVLFVQLGIQREQCVIPAATRCKHKQFGLSLSGWLVPLFQSAGLILCLW